MGQKYILTEETELVHGHTLHRIKAVRDFGCVKSGDLGGFIEAERNLSHDGNAWVYDNAKVYGDARVYDDAIVCGNACVYDNAWVYDDALICDNACVYNNAWVYDNALIGDDAKVSGHAKVYGNTRVYEHAMVYGDAWVYGDAMVCGGAIISDNAKVCGSALIRGDAKISSSKDYIVFKNWWSSYRHFTWTRSNDMWSVGCFYGSGKDLITKAYKDSEESGMEYQRIVEYVETIKKVMSKDDINREDVKK